MKLACLNDLWPYANRVDLGLNPELTFPNLMRLRMADGRTTIRYRRPTAVPVRRLAAFPEGVAKWKGSFIAPLNAKAREMSYSMRLDAPQNLYLRLI
ncbi:hypothetical protein PoB_003915200 [Plakobranchus ocellatus]|uniref:Uncharacterized protein n=1 Tax=Plakobranchus ocellatus TaxID=259542 RepID=A0AAV4B0J5_9GAST|nr:hypothetical protein PoB_003915200 [Plakobranchus ocellatus]